MRLLGWMLLAVGCGDDPDPAKIATPDPGGADSASTPDDTAGEAGAGTIEASCAVSEDNVLRYTCAVRVDPPGPVRLAFRAQDGAGPERVVTSDVVAADHVLTLYLMAPRTVYAWTASGGDPAWTGGPAEGTFETGTLPESAQVVADITGSASFPYVLLASPCDAGAAVVIMTTAGETVWYHDFARGPGQAVDAASFTEDGTVLVLTGDRIEEVDLHHQPLLDIQPVVDFERKLHHDVFRKDGLTYALCHDLLDWGGYEYNLDGYYAFDASGEMVTDWKLSDHFQPPYNPGSANAHDYTHANSIFVDDVGDVYLSMRHVSAVVKVAGNAHPNPGQILWRLSGDPNRMPLGSDFALTSPDPAISSTFLQQHNAHLRADGRLAMFDNRLPGERSRVLVVDLDEGQEEVAIVESFRLPGHCLFQGSAWHAASGNPVGGCAPERTGYEFDRGQPDVARWTMKASCLGGSNSAVPRFVPLEEHQLP